MLKKDLCNLNHICFILENTGKGAPYRCNKTSKSCRQFEGWTLGSKNAGEPNEQVHSCPGLGNNEAHLAEFESSYLLSSLRLLSNLITSNSTQLQILSTWPVRACPNSAWGICSSLRGGSKGHLGIQQWSGKAGKQLCAQDGAIFPFTLYVSYVWHGYCLGFL